MIKIIKISLFLIIFPLIGCSQTIDETLTYINNKLKKYDYGSYMGKETLRKHNTRKAQEELSNYKEVFYKFSVNDNGKLKITRLRENEKEPTHKLTVYLKQLKDTAILDRKSFGEGYKPQISIQLKCIGDEYFPCMDEYTAPNERFPEETRTTSETKISLYNYSISQKVANAIIHLIKLGHQKEDFFKKDPFSE